MYDELFLKMTNLLKTAVGDGGKEITKVTKANIDRFISICMAHGINTYTIEEMIVSHGALKSGYVIDRLEHFMGDTDGKAGASGQRVERYGVMYDSVREMARELNISQSTAQYQVKCGIARLLDD